MEISGLLDVIHFENLYIVEYICKMLPLKGLWNILNVFKSDINVQIYVDCNLELKVFSCGTSHCLWVYCHFQ